MPICGRLPAGRRFAPEWMRRKVAALRTEAGLSAILDGIGEGFYAIDCDWRIVLFNSEAARHFHCVPEDVSTACRKTCSASSCGTPFRARRPHMSAAPLVSGRHPEPFTKPDSVRFCYCPLCAQGARSMPDQRMDRARPVSSRDFGLSLPAPYAISLRTELAPEICTG